jgi:hypothetical protein
VLLIQPIVSVTECIAPAGKPIRYGEAEPWKRIKELIGTTHPARLPGHHRQRTKNDGRAFDTNEELLGIGKEKHQNPERGEENGVYSQAFVQAGLVLHKKSNKSSTQALKATSIQGYIWHRNSCWLDSSLTVLFYAISCDKPSFLSHFSSVEPETSFGRLFRVMHARQLADESSHSVNGVQQSEIRDSFCHHLFEIGAMVETEFSHQPAFVCISILI